MQRRTFLTQTMALGTLLTAGCLGGSSGGSESAETTATTESTETPTPEPVATPEPDIAFVTEGGVLRAVHMGGDQIEDEDTTEVYVTVGGERTVTWVADDEETQPYPISVGNFVEIDSATAGVTVEVVWVGNDGTESVLASHDVPETTATTTTETTADE